jgi:hypothetical protein
LSAIDGHVKGIAAHVKAMMNPEDDDTTDTVLDDPSIFDEDVNDVDNKSFLIELQKLAEQAEEFAAS